MRLAAREKSGTAGGMIYAYLLTASVFEVIATSALKATEGFTRLWPSLVTLAGYGLAFYFLSLTLRTIPVGIVYAVWSGAGIVLIAAIGWIWFRQTIDAPGLIGLALILAGVLVVNLFSKTVGH
jgi:small multidrug resistance pump